MKRVSCKRSIDIHAHPPTWPKSMLAIIVLSLSAAYIRVFAFQNHPQLVPILGITQLRRRSWIGRYDPFYYNHGTKSEQSKVTGVRRSARQLVKFDTKETENSDLRKYINRSKILEHEIRSNAKDLLLQKSKVLVLQDVVLKMKATNSALVDKLALLQDEMNSSEEEVTEHKSRVGEEENEIIKTLLENHKLALDQNERDIRETEEKLKREQKKRAAISKRCEEMTAELDLILEKHQEEIESYRIRYDDNRAQASEMRNTIQDQNMEIKRLKEVTRKNDGNSEKEKLRKECDRLESQVTLLQSQNAENKKKLQYEENLCERLRNEIDLSLEGERMRSSDFQKEIARLRNDKVDIEIAMNETRVEMDLLKERLTRSEMQEKSQNVKKEKDIILSKEAMIIATAAVEQSEERELKLEQNYKKMQIKFKNISDERDLLQHDLMQLQEMYEEDLKKVETQHEQRIQKLLRMLMTIKDEYAELKNMNEQIKISSEKKTFLDNENWGKKLSKVESDYEEIVQGLRHEIDLLTQDETNDINSIDSSTKLDLSTVKEIDAKVDSKLRSLGALWCQIWFRKVKT